MWLKNKKVVLTGASSGIGKEITKILIEKYDCFVLGIGQNGQKMIELKNLLKEKSHHFSYNLFDVSNKENWDKFVKELEDKNWEADMLINCAGMLPKFDRFENYSLELLDVVMKTNFYSAVYAIKAMLPILKKSQSPAIVNVSSSASLCALPGITYYTASKSALKNFTEALESEYKNKIYVGLICPGFTRTNIFRNQDKQVEKSIVYKFSMNVDKMAKKIVKAIKRKKKRAVIGSDACLMNMLYKLCPKSASDICGGVLKKFKVELFEDVFKKGGQE